MANEGGLVPHAPTRGGAGLTVGGLTSDMVIGAVAVRRPYVNGEAEQARDAREMEDCGMVGGR